MNLAGRQKAVHRFYLPARRLVHGFQYLEIIMALSDARLKEYVINFLLFCIVILSWTYTIYAGKFVSERHLHTLNLEKPEIVHKNSQQYQDE